MAEEGVEIGFRQLGHIAPLLAILKQFALTELLPAGEVAPGAPQKAGAKSRIERKSGDYKSLHSFHSEEDYPTGA
jgi:hypothetical protein